MESDERSEGEVSEEDEPEVPARERTVTAVGRAPGQPGKSNNSLSLSGALQDLTGVLGAGVVVPGVSGLQSGGTDQQLAGNNPASAGSGQQFTVFLQGLRELIGRFEGGQGQPPQVAP